jgi:hypothetical protein
VTTWPYNGLVVEVEFLVIRKAPEEFLKRVWDDAPHRPEGDYFLSCLADSTMAFSVGISFKSGAELLNVRMYA